MSNPNNLRAVFEQERRLAEHCFSHGQIVRALPHFRRALLVCPDSHKMQLRIGQCLDRLGKCDEAYEVYRRIFSQGIARCESSLQCEILQAYTNLCHKLSKELEVIDCFKSHSGLVEQTPALFYNLGLAFYKCRRFSEARDCFTRLKAVHSRHAAGYIGQAILYCHFGQLENA